MARRICNGCGGYVGIDCFNPSECEWIAQDEQRIRRQREEERFRAIENENAQLRKRLDELDAKALEKQS